MSKFTIWGYPLPQSSLNRDEIEYLEGLPSEIPSIKWIWEELDRVWYNFGLNNTRPLASQAIAAYYEHPTWLMNGIFSAADPISVLHRTAIANYLSIFELKSVADYGGGFGELARAIIQCSKSCRVSIVDPYPFRVSLKLLERETKIDFVTNLIPGKHEAIIAQDVLEHLEDPVSVAAQIASAVQVGGIVIFANCFYPVIQCHLPSTFYLRHTFNYVMRSLGMDYLGTIHGASHAHVFQRRGKLSLPRARYAERVSRYCGPMINRLRRNRQLSARWGK